VVVAERIGNWQIGNRQALAESAFIIAAPEDNRQYAISNRQALAKRAFIIAEAEDRQ
jgi:hypothetical protein